MRKSTAKFSLFAGISIMLAVLVVPLVVGPIGFSKSSDPITKRYLKGLGYLSAKFGANSSSSRLREVVQSTPANRVIIHYDFSSDAEREAIDQAVWAYPLSPGLKVDFLQTDVDWVNKKYIIETEKINRSWFDAEVAKTQKLFVKKP